MTSAQANAEVYYTALMAMPAEEREAVLGRIVENEELREDLLDLAVIAQRRGEPSQLFREYLAERGK
jgi:hypothetical protein